jgi:hypothetical protein
MPGQCRAWDSQRHHMAVGNVGRRQRCVRACLLWCFVMAPLVGGGDTGEVNMTGAGGEGAADAGAASEAGNAGTELEASSLFDVFADTNNVYGLVGSSDYVHYLGIQESGDACAFACVHYFLSSGGTVKMGSYVWHPLDFPSLEWQGHCFGRSEAFDIWNPKIQKGVVSGRVRAARWRRWLQRLSPQQRSLLHASAAGAHSQKYPLL